MILTMDTIELKQKLKQLDAIYIFLLADQLLLFVIAYILLRNDLFNFNAQYASQIKIFIMLANAVVIIINRLLTMVITKRAADSELEAKFGAFRKLSLLKISLVNAVNIGNTIAFLVVGDYVLAAVFGIMFILYLGARPTAKAFVRDFHLTGNNKLLVEATIN